MSVTVRAVLFGDGDPAVAMGRSRGWQGVVGGLGAVLGPAPSGVQNVVEREMATTLAGLLSLDLGQLLAAGWRAHRALVTAAHATVANPGASEVVQLATHRITTAHRPYVDVIVNGAKLVTVHFDLSLTFDVDALLGTVRGGRLVALQGGRCTVTIGLGCEGRELASRQVLIDPVLTVQLGPTGLALLREEPQPAA